MAGTIWLSRCFAVVLWDGYQLLGGREDVGLLRREVWRGSCPPLSTPGVGGCATQHPGPHPEIWKALTSRQMHEGSPLLHNTLRGEFLCLSEVQGRSHGLLPFDPHSRPAAEVWQQVQEGVHALVRLGAEHQVMRKSASGPRQARDSCVCHPCGSKRQQETAEDETKKQCRQLVPLLSAPGQCNRGRLPVWQICHTLYDWS
jgi:hypothetical protein